MRIWRTTSPNRHDGGMTDDALPSAEEAAAAGEERSSPPLSADGPSCAASSSISLTSSPTRRIYAYVLKYVIHD